MTFTMGWGTSLMLSLLLLENIYVKGFGERSFTDHELEQQLKILNKPYVKSFKIGDNDFDTFDCVNINLPLVIHCSKDIKYRCFYQLMNPSHVPTIIDHDKYALGEENVDFGNYLTQTCPTGTVPIRRTRKENLIMGQMLMENLDEHNYTYHDATVKVGLSIPYFGGHGDINIQSPAIAERTHFSSAHIKITGISITDVNTIQAGWMVYEALYNDTQPRLFTKWEITEDSKLKGGCYNTLCPGFVQVHKSIAPGFPLTSSTYGGVQQKAKFLIYKDHTNGQWWLTFGEKNEQIGYWPIALFTGLREFSIAVEWGGHVGGPPGKPSPPMGSGHFAEEGFKKAAYVNNIQFLDYKLNRHDLSDYGDYVHTAPKCYTVTPYENNGIFYGGPGGNCPST